MPAAELAERLLDRDRSAVAEALNLVDDHRPARRAAARDLLERLLSASRNGDSLRVGVTGAPGAGKSTLLDALVREVRAGKRSVGIIAVDPSSPRSGGALLGDRLRIRAGSGDDEVFVRSMAAREHLGGLAEASGAGVEILAAVFDWVFVETVGVGQSEADVAHCVDTLVFVAQPGAGDWLQAMKAGLIELPDVFVVNKADLGDSAERTLTELRAGLSLSEVPPDGWSPRLLTASARDGRGIDELRESIAAHRRHLEQRGELAARRQRGRERAVRTGLERRYGSYGIERIGGDEGLRARLQVAEGRSTLALFQEIGREIEDAFRKPR